MPRSTTVSRSPGSRMVTGGLAAAALLAVIVGVPVALALLGGDPLPHHLPSGAGIRESLLHKDVTGTLFIRVIVVIGWLAWATFALSIVVELVARLRGRRAMRLPGLGGPQRFAAGLIAAVAMAISAPASALAAPHASVAAVATPSPHGGAPAAGHAMARTGMGTSAATDVVQPPKRLVYQVRKGDYLGRIAERFGAPFSEATQIARVNHIKDPNLIDVGWRITLPVDAVDTGPHRHATGHIVAGTGTHSVGDGEPTAHAPVQPAPTTQPPAAPAATPSPGASVSPGSAPEAAQPGALAATAHEHPREDLPRPISSGATPTNPPSGGTAPDPITADSPGVDLVGEMLAASGTLAAVVSLAVVVMRRRDEASQRLGRTSVPPVAGGGALRLMAPTMVDDVMRLDAALRALPELVAGWPLDEIPQVAGVWLDHGAVTLLLADQARTAPEPFEDDANGWRLAADTRVARRTDRVAPLPLLCVVGGRERQHAFLDLEYLRVLGIGGDPAAARNLLRFIVAELCRNVWAENVRVTLAGFGPEAAALSALDPARIRVEPSVATAVAACHARLADAVANLHDVRAPDVLVVASPAMSDHAALAALEKDLMATPGVGMAVVVAPTPEGLPVGRYQMNVGGAGDLHIGFLGDALMPAACLPSVLVDDVVRLFAEARDAGDVTLVDVTRATPYGTDASLPAGAVAAAVRSEPTGRSFRAELDELTRGDTTRTAGRN